LFLPFLWIESAVAEFNEIYTLCFALVNLDHSASFVMCIPCFHVWLDWHVHAHRILFNVNQHMDRGIFTWNANLCRLRI